MQLWVMLFCSCDCVQLRGIAILKMVADDIL